MPYRMTLLVAALLTLCFAARADAFAGPVLERAPRVCEARNVPDEGDCPVSLYAGANMLVLDGRWKGATGQYRYQWQVCNTLGESCTDIPGETNWWFSPTGFMATAKQTVRALVTATDGVNETVAAAAPVGPITVGMPSQPRNVTVTPGDGSATLRWDLPADDGGLPMKSGLVSALENGAFTGIYEYWWEPRNEIVVKGLAPGRSYSFNLTLYNTGPWPTSQLTTSAVLIPVWYPLSLSTSGAGSVTVSPGGTRCEATCTLRFPADEQVTLVASGGAFNRFTEAPGCGTGDTCTVRMDRAHTISAEFEPAATPTPEATPGATAPAPVVQTTLKPTTTAPSKPSAACLKAEAAVRTALKRLQSAKKTAARQRGSARRRANQRVNALRKAHRKATDHRFHTC